MGFAVLAGVVVTTSQPLQANWLSLVFGFFTGFLLCATVITINDYYDRGIDAANESMRPIPSGLIGANTALVFVFFWLGVGSFCMFLKYFKCSLSIGCSGVMDNYSNLRHRWEGSGLQGNFLINIYVAIPFN